MLTPIIVTLLYGREYYVSGACTKGGPLCLVGTGTFVVDAVDVAGAVVAATGVVSVDVALSAADNT